MIYYKLKIHIDVRRMDRGKLWAPQPPFGQNTKKSGKSHQKRLISTGINCYYCPKSLDIRTPKAGIYKSKICLKGGVTLPHPSPSNLTQPHSSSLHHSQKQPSSPISSKLILPHSHLASPNLIQPNLASSNLFQL